MTAVALRLRAELRARRRAWFGLALIIGVAGGLVVALGAAASREQGSFGRYERASAAGHAYIAVGFAFGDLNLDLDRFARLPMVARSERKFLVAVLSRTRDNRPIYPMGPGSIQYEVAADDRPANTIDAPQLRSGRLPDPNDPDEALADAKALDRIGIDLGDMLTVRVVSRDAMLHRFSEFHAYLDPRGPRARVWGTLATVRIVGVRAQAKTDVDSGYVNFTPAFRRRHGGPHIGAWAQELAVRLRRGQDDVPAFRAAATHAAGGRAYGFFDAGSSRPAIQQSIDLMALSLRLLAAFGAAALVLLAGQALLRGSAIEARAGPTLRALGMTDAQLVGLGAARGALIGGPAALTAAVTAALLSPLAPVGWARELEPDRGLQLDWGALTIGVAAILTAVVTIGALGAWQGARRGAGGTAARSTRSRSVAEVLTRAGLPPAAATGIRMALVRRARTTTVPVRTTLASGVAAVAVAMVALTFADSLGHLLDTPRLFGQNWDYETGLGPPAGRDVVRAILRDPGVSDVAEGYVGPATVDGRRVGMRALQQLEGSVFPTLVDGRTPRADDEVLLGTKTMRACDVGIGDRVTLRVAGHDARLRVVGRGVLPADKWNELGEGAAVRLGAVRRFVPAATTGALHIRFARHADRDAVHARLDRLLDGTIAQRPQSVGDFGRIRAMPALIALVFGVAAAAALAHLLLTSLRRRRRDLAILKTLGFTGGQVRATVAWQATTVATVSVLVGIPLGIALGRFGWRVFAGSVGIVPEPVTPVGPAIVVVPAALLLANAIAALPAHVAAATRPAVVLRAE